MPFKSEAQRRYLYAAEDRGKVPKGTAERWEDHTKDNNLPDRVSKKAEAKKTIAVDLDGTLAKYKEWVAIDSIGDPITKMVSRVKKWLEEGHTVHIFTARAFPQNSKKTHQKAIKAIEVWCEKYIGQKLPVTYKKDPKYDEFWDDKAIQIKKNTGQRADGVKEAAKKPYRDRVDVYAVNNKGKLYSGTYPDGSIGLFGGGVDSGETVIDAANREFLEEAGLKVENTKRLHVNPYKESLIARQGWIAAGKLDRAKQYGGTRTYSVVADVVKGVKQKLTEPADHIKKVKYRTLQEAIELQQKALKKPEHGKKGILEHRLQALKKVKETVNSGDKDIMMEKAAVLAQSILRECAKRHPLYAEVTKKDTAKESLRKCASQYYDMYGNPAPEQKSAIKPMAIGAGIGGVGAHLLPNEFSSELRTQAKATDPANAYLKQTLKRKAFGANLGRLAKAILLGAAAGGLAHEITN